MLGPDYLGRKPHFEGQTLTVIGFKPRYVNSVMVQDSSGMISLLPLDDVDRVLRSGGKVCDTGEVSRGRLRNGKSRFTPESLSEAQEQSELGCQASISNRNYVPCGKLLTHVLEFTDEEARKCLVICENHAGLVGKRTILDGWCNVSVTPL
jgi:hypothetical protein